MFGRKTQMRIITIANDNPKYIHDRTGIIGNVDYYCPQSL